MPQPRRLASTVTAALALALLGASAPLSATAASSPPLVEAAKGQQVVTTSADDPERAAAAFTGSVGVNVHWHFGDTPYGTQYQQVKTLLKASGIPQVRGDAFRAADLFATTGITTSVPVDVDQNLGDPATQVAALAPLAASGAVTAVEGPNEPDGFWKQKGYTYQGQGFPGGVIAWQRDLYSAVKANPTTAGLTVIGPALGGTYWDGNNPLPDGVFAGTADDGNFHPYPGPNTYTSPTPYAGIAKYYWQSDFPSIALDRYPINLTSTKGPYSGKPMVATETGYSTWRYGPSETVQGRYMPRTFLEDFRLGIAKTFSYEFLDEFPDPSGAEREDHFGLVRSDLTPKPAYYAVQSLMSAVADPGAASGSSTASLTTAAAATLKLDYRLAVTPPAGYDAGYLHHVTLRRSDGSVVMALWHEVGDDDTSGVDATPQRPVVQVTQPAMDVSLDLGARADGVQVSTVDDAGHLQAASTHRTGNSYDFAVPDRVTFVTIPASAASRSTTGSATPSTGTSTGASSSTSTSPTSPTGTASSTSTSGTPDSDLSSDAGGDGAATRVAGDDRISTAVAVASARTSGAQAPAAVLANSHDAPDATPGTALAAKLGATMLLTPTSTLDDRVAAALTRGVTPGGTVYLLGGTSALAPSVESAVKALGFSTHRMAGDDRAATAAAIASELLPTSGGCDVLLASGSAIADQAVAAGLSTAKRPVLFSDGKILPAATTTILDACAASGPSTLTAIGGDAVAASRSAPPAFAVTALAGTDRYDTSARALTGSGCGAGASRVVLAGSHDFADATVGATYGIPVLLTSAKALPDPVLSALSQCSGTISGLTVVGGTKVVSPAVARAAAAAVTS